MDEEWELLTKESEPKTDILQEYVDEMDESGAKTEKNPHLGNPDQHQMYLVDSKVHKLFMQTNDRVLRVTESDPGTSDSHRWIQPSFTLLPTTTPTTTASLTS